jgi:2-methylaconitate cis-trans-isomerase PrpF
MTVAICTAVAAEIPGSIVQTCVRDGEPADPEGLVIAHSSGRVTVGADIVKDEKGETNARAGTIYQTCRKLFEGSVFYRA